MTQPILFKNSLSIALLTLVQLALSCIIATVSLYVAVRLAGKHPDEYSVQLTIAIAILCLSLIKPPSDISSQLSIQPAQAVLSISLRYLLAVVVLYTIATITHTQLLTAFQFGDDH